MVYAPHYCSYLPILIKTLQHSVGPVLELGMGPFSTPLLHWLCFDMNRTLVSYDNNLEYFDSNSAFADKNHLVLFVKEWDNAVITDRHWGVVFLDQAPALRRKEDAKRLINNVDFLVMHDSENSKDQYFKYSEIYPLFKYRYNYRRGSPFTVVLSNIKDVVKILR